MKFVLPLPPGHTPQTVIQKCGYATLRDPRATEISFVRRLGGYFYPRFHLYFQAAAPGGVHASLHLDMKQPSYIQGHAHSGEYGGEQVENEVRRILTVAQSLARTS